MRKKCVASFIESSPIETAFTLKANQPAVSSYYNKIQQNENVNIVYYVMSSILTKTEQHTEIKKKHIRNHFFCDRLFLSCSLFFDIVKAQLFYYFEF